MITHHYFNKILDDYLTRTNNDITSYLRITFKNHYSNNYFDFLDDFLGNYGISSINYVVPNNSNVNKHVSYVNFQEENIFNEPAGIKELSTISLSKKSSQEILANYLISKLNFIRPEKFENWTN